MGRLVIATRNPGKLAEMRQIIARIVAPHAVSFDIPAPPAPGCGAHATPRGGGLVLLSLSGFPGVPRVAEGKEDFRSNAIRKAVAAAGATGLPALADDSGLEVDGLGGLPGPVSSRYAGEGATDAENNAKLMEKLAEIPADDPRRAARFRCVAAIVWPGGACAEAEGVCEGRIALAPRGEGGFGYDPLFEVAGLGGATMAELGEEVKNRISHRAKALEGLRDHLLALAAGAERGVAWGGQRRVRLDEYVAAHRGMSRRIWLEAEGASHRPHRNVRRRPRSPEESEILTRLGQARLMRAVSSGELVVLAPRRYRLRVFS